MALDAAHRAGHDVSVLFNMLTEDGEYSRSHGLKRSLLEAQARAMGKRILFGRAAWDDYERVFLERLDLLRSQGISTGLFGDIDLEAHREWVERVCRIAGFKAVLPLWNMDRESHMNNFLSSGYRAVVISVREDALDRKWLGRNLDEEAVEAFQKAGIDLCGEEGEYHTFVFDGPLFEKPLEFIPGRVKEHEGYAFLELRV